MFLFRSIFWLGVVVMLLPPASDGSPPPRANVLATLSATRTLARDLSETCERNPRACEISGETLTLMGLKLETGIRIFTAALTSDQTETRTGTLTDQDQLAEWAASDPD